MSQCRFRFSSLCVVQRSLAGCFALAGCSANVLPVPVVPAIAVSGNWQIASTDAVAARLPLLSGELSGSTKALQGIVHSDSAQACIAPATVVALSGSADALNKVTLTGALGGGTLTITGTMAADGKSLTTAAYNVTGGNCAFTAPATAVAQAFSPVSGTFTGGFSDAIGQVVSITATLTQNPSADPSGNFQLSGSATFPNNPCFSSPVSISNSVVTGGTFTQTYADPVTMNSVSASGTFSTDGGTLTVTNWSLTGSCGPDSGTGLLTRH